jgi:molybdopterin-containing oxidoreductase family membrane subunit
MLETALKGNKWYWLWIMALLGVIGGGSLAYLYQFMSGLQVTGMSRDVSWGFYIAQLTFLVGVAAGGVMLVLPYYLHDYKKFGKVTIVGEFVAVAAVSMCMTFVLVDLGQPIRMLNLFLHPTPNSVLLWDATVLSVYLLLNIIIGWKVLEAERNAVAPPKWVKPLIYISIPWAFTIHTVTAFLYCGLPGRGFWLTAILAPRFLSSAFAAGPAFVILICFILKKFTKFDAGKDAIQALAKIITYALIANVFFMLCEAFVVFYSQIPEHMDHFKYLYWSDGILVPWMWASVALMLIGIILLVNPITRKNEFILGVACVVLFIGTWIDKGMGLISGGFVPSPLHHYHEYVPTLPELTISAGIYGIGFLMITVLLKITVSIREETGAAA